MPLNRTQGCLAAGDVLGSQIMSETSKRGFASMDADRKRAIASKGGRAAHAKGTAHEFTPDEAREAGRKGGQAVSRNRDHMASIGRRGGETVSRDREHMANIGRKGGESGGNDEAAGHNVSSSRRTQRRESDSDRGNV